MPKWAGSVLVLSEVFSVKSAFRLFIFFFSILPPAPLPTASSLPVWHWNVFAVSSLQLHQQQHIGRHQGSRLFESLMPSSQETSPLPQAVLPAKLLKSHRVAPILELFLLIDSIKPDHLPKHQNPRQDPTFSWLPLLPFYFSLWLL